MAAQSSVGPRLHPTICVDAERREHRSIDPEIALQLQLQRVLDAHDLELIVIGDLDGAAVATAGPGDAAMELAELAAGIAKDHPTWQSMVTSRGFVVVQRVDVRLRTYVVAAQSRFNLPDVRGVARAVEGALRILRHGIALDTPAPMALVCEGGWGDWPELDVESIT